MPDFRARLYLVTPPLRTAADLLPELAAALGAGDVASLLLRLQDLPQREAINVVREIAPLVQGNGTALLLEDPRIAARAGADGMHVAEPGNSFTAALDSLKPARIVGVGGLSSRDDAMRAGEAGADYLMFGDPVRGERASAEDTLDQVRWWAEIFNVPCVGFAQTLQDVRKMVEAGADFVALGDAVWADPRGSAAAVAEAQGFLAEAVARLEEVKP